MWRRKHNRRSSVSAACPSSYHASRGRLAARPVLRSAPRPVSRFALLACLICPRCGFRRLIISSARLSLGGLLPPHRLIGSPLASYRPAPRPIRHDGRGGTIGGGVSCHAADCGHRMAGGCLLTSDGDGLRAVIDGGWRRAAGVAVCLPRGDRRSGSIVPRSFLFSSHRLIQSVRPRLIPIISSSHRRGRSLLFLFA